MYRIDFNEFFTSAFSVDCMLFGYIQGQIKTLLIKSAMEPFDKFWAIPGDLVHPDEDLDAAANRILNDLTGLLVPRRSVEVKVIVPLNLCLHVI